MGDNIIVKRGLVGAVIAGIFILAFFVLKPIIIPILFGLLFAYIFNPVYKRIQKKVVNRSFSAIILIILLILLIAIPIIYIVPMLITQIFDTYILLQDFHTVDVVGKFFEPATANMIASNIEGYVGTFFSTLMRQFTNLLSDFPSLLLQFAVFLFTFFFAIRDSEKLSDYVSKLSPFSSSTEEKFTKELRGITNAIVFGQVLIGIIQGLALGAGLFFLGVPKVLILTFVAAIVSMIPVLGSWLVWLPVSVVLLISGQIFAGIFLILYGAIFVSTIDNFLRPYFLSKQSNLPVVLSVIGTIGGLFFFGIAGLVLGPLILAYVLIIIEFYQQGKLNELFKK